MLLKFFKRGGTDDDRRTLGGSAVKNYLLGTNDQPRKKARLLLGDADEVTEIINGLPFAKVYTSGCLSFHEDDKLTDVVLTQAALRQQTDEPLTCQDDVAKLLENFGFEISRRGKDSISIKNPDPTKKNLRTCIHK